MRTLSLCLVMLLSVGSAFAQAEAADEDFDDSVDAANSVDAVSAATEEESGDYGDSSGDESSDEYAEEYEDEYAEEYDERVYADEDFAPLVAAFDSLFGLTEQFIFDLESAVDASSVEAAIRLYTSAMGQLRAEIMRIAEEDPGLVSSQEIPPAMMASLERLNGLNARMQEVGPVVAQYENDPGVVDALKGFEGMDF